MISIDKDKDKGSDLNSGTRESLNLAKAILEPSLATKWNGKEVKYDKKGWGGGNYIGGEIIGVEDKLLINIVSYLYSLV